MPVDVRNYIQEIGYFKTINKKLREDAVPLDVGTVAQNLRYDINSGYLTKRNSRAKYGNMTTLGTSKVIHGDRYYTAAGGKTQIIGYSTFIKTGDDSTGAFTNLYTGLTADVHKRSLTYKDIWYCCDYTNTNKAYDGTNAETWGVPTGGTVSGVDASEAGNPDGAYKYKVTYVMDSYQEGNAGAASDTVTVTTNKITVTIPVSTNGRVTGRKIYRTAASGAVYYLLATVANNTDVAYTDNIGDSDLGATTAPSDYSAPPQAKYMCLHKERIFMFYTTNGKSDLIYSDIRSGTSYPDVFPALNIEYIAPDDGDIGTEIAEDYLGNLICFKQNGIYRFNTDTDDPVGWSISDKLSPHGSVAQNVARTPYGIYFIAKYGELKKRIMLWNGAQAQPVFDEVEPIITAIEDIKLVDVKLHYHNGYLYVTYQNSTTGNLYNDEVLTIDLISGGFNIDKKNVAHFWSWNGSGDWGELYTGTSDTTGFVYREDTTGYDLIIRLKSELDLGTFTQTVSGGTEQAPTVKIVEADLANDIGATIANAASGAADTYTGITDTGWPSGAYTSPVLEINAKNLLYLYWSEVVAANTIVAFWIRTGDTTAEVAAASWSGPYKTAAGTDISALTAKRYIQYRFNLHTKVTTDASGVYVYRDDYVIKITAGLGTLAESAIEMIWESGFMDFGWKRYRKRIRQVKLEFDRSVASGTLTYSYYQDWSTSKTDVSIDLATYAASGQYIYQFPLGVYPFTIKHRLYNNDINPLTIKRISYQYSVEPFQPTL